MRYLITVSVVLLLLFLVSGGRSYAADDHQHGVMEPSTVETPESLTEHDYTIVHHESSEHDHGEMGYLPVITGVTTFISMLFTFCLGFLGRRGIIKFRAKAHLTGAYITVFCACVHLAVNLFMH